MKMNLKSGSGRMAMKGCCTKRKSAPDAGMSQDGKYEKVYMFMITERIGNVNR